MKKCKIIPSIVSAITSNVIIIMGLFVYSCENTITNNSARINYGVVINEINYRSFTDFQPGDWVELHNTTNEVIAIGLWKLKDNDDDHVFTIPENKILLAHDFIVLCREVAAFENLFSGVTNIIGDLEFGLGGGDQVRLFDSGGLLVDMVEYDEEDPWPTQPDGIGFTLELIHPYLENDMAENWAAIAGIGTPGKKNSMDVK